MTLVPDDRAFQEAAKELFTRYESRRSFPTLILELARDVLKVNGNPRTAVCFIPDQEELCIGLKEGAVEAGTLLSFVGKATERHSYFKRRFVGNDYCSAYLHSICKELNGKPIGFLAILGKEAKDLPGEMRRKIRHFAYLFNSVEFLEKLGPLKRISEKQSLAIWESHITLVARNIGLYECLTDSSDAYVWQSENSFYNYTASHWESLKIPVDKANSPIKVTIPGLIDRDKSISRVALAGSRYAEIHTHDFARIKIHRLIASEDEGPYRVLRREFRYLLDYPARTRLDRILEAVHLVLQPYFRNDARFELNLLVAEAKDGAGGDRKQRLVLFPGSRNGNECYWRGLTSDFPTRDYSQSFQSVNHNFKEGLVRLCFDRGEEILYEQSSKEDLNIKHGTQRLKRKGVSAKGRNGYKKGSELCLPLRNLSRSGHEVVGVLDLQTDLKQIDPRALQLLRTLSQDIYLFEDHDNKASLGEIGVRWLDDRTTRMMSDVRKKLEKWVIAEEEKPTHKVVTSAQAPNMWGKLPGRALFPLIGNLKSIDYYIFKVEDSFADRIDQTLNGGGTKKDSSFVFYVKGGERAFYKVVLKTSVPNQFNRELCEVLKEYFRRLCLDTEVFEKAGDAIDSKTQFNRIVHDDGRGFDEAKHRLEALRAELYAAASKSQRYASIAKDLDAEFSSIVSDCTGSVSRFIDFHQTNLVSHARQSRIPLLREGSLCGAFDLLTERSVAVTAASRHLGAARIVCDPSERCDLPTLPTDLSLLHGIALNLLRNLKHVFIERSSKGEPSEENSFKLECFTLELRISITITRAKVLSSTSLFQSEYFRRTQEAPSIQKSMQGSRKC